MNILPFLIPLPAKTNFKPQIIQGNSFLKEKKLQKAWNSYQNAFQSLWDNWEKFNNDYYWPENTFIPNQEYKFIYCGIHKVASSTFRNYILKLNDLEDKIDTHFELWHYCHYHLSFYSFNYGNALKILNDKNYFKFTFVRNPWARLLSGYLNKFVTKNKLEHFAYDVITDIYNYKNEKLDLDKSITFEEFLRYLSRKKNNSLDYHWKPQYLFLGRTKFDFIGKIENLKEDFEYLKNKLNLPYGLPQRNTNKYTETPTKPFNTHWSKLTPNQLKNINQYPRYKEFYNEELIELVRNRYQKDLKMFYYQFT